MLVLTSIDEIRDFINKTKIQKKAIGLVPTMGYFHQGHLELMKIAKKQCDVVVVSIYVNPLQFGPKEDLAAYPRDLERDMDMARDMGVDVVFSPNEQEMYPEGFDTLVEVGDTYTNKLCGRSRPGHFTGVATVVAKLFNIVKPHKAFFGQKDAQQVLVIKRMVSDLNIDVEIITVPIVRERDGLAMSSRNVYLTPDERSAATILHSSLQKAHTAAQGGEINPSTISDLVSSRIKNEPLAKLEYVEIYSYPDLNPVASIQGSVLLAVAARFGKARLIDNTILEVE